MLKVERNWHVCWEKETEKISTMEVANEMTSTINIATQVKTEMNFAMK